MGKLKLEKKKKNGKSNVLLSVVLGVVLAAVVLTCVAVFVSTQGVAMRFMNAMKSPNYRVNGNMMSYYYMNTYNNFSNTYNAQMPYFSIGTNSTIETQKATVFGGTSDAPNQYDTTYLGNFDGTWFDFFMQQTTNGVKSMLVYCEEANERGITLDDEDKESIEKSIDSNISQIKTSLILSSGGASANYSEAVCLKLMYGEGVKRRDIRKAMELSTLAAKAQQAVVDSIGESISDDSINAEYDANKKNYDLADYFYYRFSVSYTDAVKEVLGKEYKEEDIEPKKDEILVAYKAKIEKAKAAASELEEITDLAEFKSYVRAYVADQNYDSAYNGMKPENEFLPTEEQLEVIKAGIKKAVVDEVNSGAKTANDDVQDNDGVKTLYGVEVKNEFAEAAKKIKTDIFASVYALDAAYTVEQTSYAEGSELSEWIFAADRKIGDIKKLEEGDGIGTAEITKDKEYFRASVYYMTKAVYKSEEKARDVAYMLFTSNVDANAAIEKISALETLNTDEFKKIAEEGNAAGNTVYKDYTRGSMQSAEFDAWLYDPTTVPGTYTATALSMLDGSFMVAYYVEDGEPSWYVKVKNSLSQAKADEISETIEAKFGEQIKTNEWVAKRIG